MASAQARLNPEDLPHARSCLEFVLDSPSYREEEPYEVLGYLPPEQEGLRSNMKWEPHDVLVYDLRKQFDTLSIDKNGFEFVSRPDLTVPDLTTEKGLEEYLLRGVDFIKERFNSEDVVLWNYNVRHASPDS
jgi:hypothetical protein